MGDDEEYDTNSICIANIDNAQNQEDKIIIGSFQGKLRIFKPNRKKNNQFHVEDLIIEKNMGFPILQVRAGKFAKNQDRLCLAILGTRALSIHMVESTATFSKMTEMLSHKLDRNGFNFIHGHFGSDRSKNEQICVQSIDGALIMIDFDFVLFKIQLPDYLIPGPLAYAKDTESIIIANSNLEIECYNFMSMKAFTNNDLEAQREQQAKEDSKARMEPSWVSNIGEQARQICMHFNKYTQQTDVMVLGEYSLFILTEHQGQIRYQKRLNFSPSYMMPYHLDTPGSDIQLEEGEMLQNVLNSAATKQFDQGGLRTPGFMNMIINFDGFLNIYKDTKLAWTTELSTKSNVFVQKANFQGLQGLIVTFSDSGHLGVSYLGTEQMSQSDLGKLHQNNQEVDYEKMQKKHAMIMEQIRQQENESTKAPQDSLTINLQVAKKVEQVTEYLDDPDNILARTSKGQLYRLKVKVTLSYEQAAGQAGVGFFKNVQINLRPPRGVMADRQQVKFDQLVLSGANTPPTEQIILYATKDMVPQDLHLEATLTYQQVKDQKQLESEGSGALRTDCTSSLLPVSFFLSIIEPVKESQESKIHFVMQGLNMLSSLPDTFKDMFDMQQCDESFKQRRNITFQYHDGETSSILVSKDEKKIRIQANSLCQQWLVINELTSILEQTSGGQEIYDIISYD